MRTPDIAVFRPALRSTAGLFTRHWLAALSMLPFAVRLLTLGTYPLTDTTEARYGEIARKMLETGQWIVPQIDYGVPFWGKPPLSFWLTAASYKLFGIGEFAARLPSLLIGVAVCALTYALARRRGGIDHGLRASAVASTSLLMVVCCGGVMTDPAMLLGTTLSMVGFWQALATRSRRWGWLFFVGIAIGLLAKGPVATVLTLLPVGAWAVMTGRVRETLQRLPWLSGIALAAALSLPWYLMAENRSPGFLHYFIVGEHWQRYTISGWKGDLYGSGHAYPRGLIWLDALLGMLPWSPWLLWLLARGRAGLRFSPRRAGDDGWTFYLLCWLLAPPLFFTMARNILPTYVLPAMPAFALLVAEAWTQRRAREGDDGPAPMLALAAPALLLVVLLGVWPRFGYESERDDIARLHKLDAHAALVYFPQRPYSAQFYSQGEALQAADATQLRDDLERRPWLYVAARPNDLGRLPADLHARLRPVLDTKHYVFLRHD